jgi:hypothetical protein
MIFIKPWDRGGHHVDVTTFAIGLAKVLNALAEHPRIEPVAILHGKLGAQSFYVLVGFVAAKGDAAQSIALAFFNRNDDIDALTVRGMQGEGVDAAGIADVGLGLTGESFGVALVAVGLAHPVRIFVQLAGVEGTREDVLEDDGVGNADGLQVLHRRHQFTVGERMVAGEGDLAYLDGRTFLDDKRQRDARRRNGLDLGPDHGKLMAVLTEHLLQYHFGALHARLVKLAFDVEGDLLLLEALHHVGDRD